jgi:aspartate kinase
MIVMKFGGSSLESADSIHRVVSIVRSEACRHPVVVTSAMGDTTDRLLDLLSAARKANSYSAWNLQEAIKNQHFAACEELLHGHQHSAMNQYLRDTFRDLHVRMLEVCEGERSFSPELQDWTVSLGEQLSSRLVPAVLQEHCGDTLHLDARKLILTNSNFTNAEPRYWETYARIRWSVPIAARDKLVVLGGFIGSTEDGRTTTLGRGGSDITASIVGAAVNADEIQVWKDVDGMLTADPRIVEEAHQVRRLSYEEATKLANAGATILHPETMAPARRLCIPIVIRNTFHPGCEGTRIEGATAQGAYLVKSIAAKSNVLEIRSADRADDVEALIAFCRQYGSEASVLFSSERMLYIAVNENSKIPDEKLAPGRCLEVRARTRRAILTLVGSAPEQESVAKRLTAVLQGIPAFVVPSKGSACSVSVAVPQEKLKSCIDLLHRAFFSTPDPQLFVARNTSATKQDYTLDAPSLRHAEKLMPFVLSAGLFQTN